MNFSFSPPISYNDGTNGNPHESIPMLMDTAALSSYDDNEKDQKSHPIDDITSLSSVHSPFASPSTYTNRSSSFLSSQSPSTASPSPPPSSPSRSSLPPSPPPPLHSSSPCHYRLVSPHVTHEVKSLVSILGRSSSIPTPAQYDGLPYFVIGSSMLLSRKHFRIQWNANQSQWEIVLLGRNSFQINGENMKIKKPKTKTDNNNNETLPNPNSDDDESANVFLLSSTENSAIRVGESIFWFQPATTK